MEDTETAIAVPNGNLAAVHCAERQAGPGHRSAEEQLADIRLEFAEVYRELYEAAQMQRQLSGPRVLRRGSFEVAAEIFPVRHLSGDFFSVSELGTTIVLAVGDIAGKGLLAGMWFTCMLGMTRTYAESFPDPSDTLAAINQQLCGAGPRPPLTSLWVARLKRETGEFVYSNAGHPPPVILRADGSVELLEEGGPVMGAVAGASYNSACGVLKAGDVLVGYSDGLLESCNEDDEQFGVQRVIEEMRKAQSDEPASKRLFSLIGAAQDFAGSHARSDDCTIMVVRHL
jgi:sigma-B regulation protein RsbU (phosphoserine phosphatase)